MVYRKGKWWIGNTIINHYVPNSILETAAFNETYQRFQVRNNQMIFLDFFRLSRGSIFWERRIGTDIGLLALSLRIKQTATFLYVGAQVINGNLTLNQVASVVEGNLEVTQVCDIIRSSLFSSP
jgi:hypothetical protein